MIRVAIVEDEAAFAQELKAFLLQFAGENNEHFAITLFTDGDEIAEHYSGEFELILMDIQMQFMDGMTAAEKIRQTDQDVVIMFITNRTDYAIRGYQVDALDYLLKPVNYVSFSQKLQRAMNRIISRERYQTVLSTRNGMLRLDTGKIYYIENEGHRLIYHTVFEDYSVRARLADVEEELKDHGFIRCNKGCLVNMKHVEGIVDGCVIVHQQTIPVSRARRSALMEALSRYL